MNTFINQITFVEKKKIEVIFESNRSGEDVVASSGGYSVNQDSFKCLIPGTWLNEEVINYFLKVCLTKRDEMLCPAIPCRKRSFFFDGKYNYNEIQTYGTEKLQKTIYLN
jgi:Ulp1 family protease